SLAHLCPTLNRTKDRNVTGMQEDPRSSAITLQGSMEIMAEFFSFGINSILYQCGIYPSETFTPVQKYGLTLLLTMDPELIKYLNSVVEQLKVSARTFKMAQRTNILHLLDSAGLQYGPRKQHI
uniref:HORMA domain-containing protein n=1 Tax=Marmota marmota marmota TaxID=9994 RepID=A0A8C5ZMM8_MARMA